MKQFTETWQEVVEKWKKGEIVSSAELGGIGPGYEQAIQVLLFEIMARWENKPVPAPKGEVYPAEYDQHVDRVVGELNKIHGFSGAQVGVAKATAYQFMHYGYAEMMNKLPIERHILVSKNFPSAA